MYVRRMIAAPIIWHFCKWQLLNFTLVSATVFAGFQYGGWKFLAIPFLPIATIGTAVAFYVGFKNHASYERLWEARKIWGSITNVSRSFAAAVINLVRSKDGKKNFSDVHRELIYRHLAWVHILRIELRNYNPWPDMLQTELPQVVYLQKLNFPVEQQCEREMTLQRFLSASEREALGTKITTHLLGTQIHALTKLKDEGIIDEFEHSNLLRMITDCFDYQGGAERINSFPFPRQYANFSLVFVQIFTFLLPFGLIGEFDKMNHGLTWLTIPFSVLISWMFITMEQVGDTSENPFEMGINDVPLTTICRNIEIDLRRYLEEDDLPDPILPVSHVLV